MPTVGVLKAKGWHGLRVHCRPCNSLRILIWAYLRQSDETEIESLAPRLRCRTCGTRPDPTDATPYYLDTSQAQGASAPPEPR